MQNQDLKNPETTSLPNLKHKDAKMMTEADVRFNGI
jgi:hypothetical protein